VHEYACACVCVCVCVIYFRRASVDSAGYCCSVTHSVLSYMVCHLLVMGWLRSVGSMKLHVSFAEYRLFYRALLQKRPIILSILLSEATPYVSIHDTYRPFPKRRDSIYIDETRYVYYASRRTCVYTRTLYTYMGERKTCIYVYIYIMRHGAHV